jgi:enamine deaminase RidA (YjgF/YER057c/UK114 family)
MMLTAHTLNDRICAHSNNAAHGMEVPPNARVLFCNGQVGARLDGAVPEDPLEQIEVIFERIRVILVASNMTFKDVVKFTVYVGPVLRAPRGFLRTSGAARNG